MGRIGPFRAKRVGLDRALSSLGSRISGAVSKTITCRARKVQLSDPQNKLEIFTFPESVAERSLRER